MTTQLKPIPYYAILDLKGDNKIDFIKCTVGDSNAYQLNVSVVIGRVPYDLTGNTVQITYYKADKTTVTQDLTIDGDAINGKCHVIFDTDAISYPGKVQAEINIFDSSNGRLTTGTFSMLVQSGLLNQNTITSSNEFSSLTTAISTVTDFTNTKTELQNARQGYTDLLTNLQNKDAQLADITQFKLIADINGTTYLNSQSIDYGYIRQQQEYLYGQFYRNLLKGSAVQICCAGDSLTYGQDTTSADKRSPDPVLCPDGSSHTITRAGVSYPEALQTNLQSIFGSQVTVINRGYSGDWVRKGYTRWYTQHSSNLTILMFGTNDSRASWVDADIRGNLQAYVDWYEQIIIREIVWGKAVIILTPPKLQTANDVDIKTFANALKAIGEKYSVPVVDSTRFSANYPSTIYSDSVHFNTNGYKVFASKVTSLIISGNASNPNTINDGDILLTRPNVDNVLYYGGAVFGTTGGGVETPAEVNATTGIVASWTGTGMGLIYNFYTAENDMMIIPYFYSSTRNLRLTLDFNTVSAQNSLDDTVDNTIGLSESPTKQVVYSLPSNSTSVDRPNQSHHRCISTDINTCCRKRMAYIANRFY